MPDEDAYLTDHGRSRAHSGAPGGCRTWGHGTAVPPCASACSRVRRTGGTRGGSRTAPTPCMATALMAAMITRCQTLREKITDIIYNPRTRTVLNRNPWWKCLAARPVARGGITSPHGRPGGSPIRCAARTAAGLAYAAPKCTAVSGRRTASPLRAGGGRFVSTTHISVRIAPACAGSHQQQSAAYQHNPRRSRSRGFFTQTRAGRERGRGAPLPRPLATRATAYPSFRKGRCGLAPRPTWASRHRSDRQFGKTQGYRLPSLQTRCRQRWLAANAPEHQRRQTSAPPL